MIKRKDLFVIVPAYNEASSIGKVIFSIRKFTKNIIVVDDGSSDKTKEVSEKAGAVVFRHRLNLGKGASMKTGAEAAKRLGAEVIIFLDGDGQHDPGDLPSFLEKINEGNEVVFGSRDLSSGVPWERKLGNNLGSFFINLFYGIKRDDLLCGFLAMTAKSFRKINWQSSRYGVETEIVAKVGKDRLKYAQVPIKTIYLDKYKGLTILETLEILFNIPSWRL